MDRSRKDFEGPSKLMNLILKMKFQKLNAKQRDFEEWDQIGR